MVSVLRLKASILALLGVLLGAGATAAPLQVTLGTATPGGGFQLYGQTLAELAAQTDPSLVIEPVATGGSRDNLARLEAGSLDIALVEGNAARVALEGIGRSPAPLRVLFVMYPNPGAFVVRADSPYRRIEDLRGQRITLGTRASGLRILGGDILDGLGLDARRDVEDVVLERAGDGPSAVLDGELAALWGAGIGWPGFRRVAEGPLGARFITPGADEIAQIRARHPHLRPMTLPAGSYPGQDEALDSLGLWSLILTRADLPEETAYRLAKSLNRSGRALAARLPQGRYTLPCATYDQVPEERLHPGTLRHLREEGFAP
jgi:TRAP transporter TAXI family solute receptor